MAYTPTDAMSTGKLAIACLPLPTACSATPRCVKAPGPWYLFARPETSRLWAELFAFFSLTLRTNSSKSLLLPFIQLSPSKPFAITSVPCPLPAAAFIPCRSCLPWVLSQTSSSPRNSRFVLGFLESQFTFHRFTHSVCRFWRRSRTRWKWN
jgi:hypothetical protein